MSNIFTKDQLLKNQQKLTKRAKKKSDRKNRKLLLGSEEDESLFEGITMSFVDKLKLEPLFINPKLYPEYTSDLVKRAQDEQDTRDHDDRTIRRKKKSQKTDGSRISLVAGSKTTLHSGKKKSYKSGVDLNKEKKDSATDYYVEDTILSNGDLGTRNSGGKSVTDSRSSTTMKQQRMLNVLPPIAIQSEISLIPRSIFPKERIQSLKLGDPMSAEHRRPSPENDERPHCRVDVTPAEFGSEESDGGCGYADVGGALKPFDGNWAALLEKVQREHLKRHYTDMIDNKEYEDAAVVARESQLMAKLSKSSVNSIKSSVSKTEVILFNYC